MVKKMLLMGVIGGIMLFQGNTALPISQTDLIPDSKNEVNDSKVRYAFSMDKLVKAIIWVESGGRPNVRGSFGERGLMQIGKSTFKHMKKKNRFDYSWDDMWKREPNIAVGKTVLVYLAQRLNGDFDGVVLAYNCGLSKYLARKAPKRSYRYLNKVKQMYKKEV